MSAASGARPPAGRPPSPARHSPGFVALLYMLTLSAYDGNLLILSATGVLFHPEVLVFSGLFSVAGPGSWLAAFAFFSANARSASAFLNHEFREVAVLSGLVVPTAAVGGSLVGGSVHLMVLPYFGALAIAIVSVAIVTGARVPSLTLGAHAIPLPSAVILMGAAVEVAMHLLVAGTSGGLTRIGGIEGVVLAYRCAEAVVVWGIAWASVCLFTRIPVERLFDRRVLRLFGGAAILLVASSVAGVPVGTVVFSPLLAPFAVLFVFALGLAVAYLVRRSGPVTN
jgi:hypothetical protein